MYIIGNPKFIYPRRANRATYSDRHCLPGTFSPQSRTPDPDHPLTLYSHASQSVNGKTHWQECNRGLRLPQPLMT